MDRISKLPNGIITHILSFLPTEEAAPTSLLSKRWRDMFAFSPNLCFTRIGPNKNMGLQSFIDRVLAVSGTSTIRRFTLTRYVGSALWERTMVSNVLNRGVLELDLTAQSKPDSSLVLFEVFACQRLVKLKLFGFYIPMLPEGAFLPALKTLSLTSSRFNDLETYEKLISACPSLDELIIKAIYFEDWRLRSMSFDYPNLVFLKYVGCVQRQYPVVNLDSLVEAKLELVMMNPACDLSNLMKGLRNVKILHLTLDIFGDIHEAMPVFKNLIHLYVKRACEPSSYLPYVLKKSPKLHTLVIEGPVRHNDTVIDCKCLLECPVKVLEVTVYECGIKEMEQIKHYLEGFSYLELVKVFFSTKEDKEKLRLITNLLMLPRASPKCKIQLEFS